MILEVEMSPNKDNPDDVKKGRTKYLWFGYGGYANGGEPAAFNPTNIRLEPGVIERLLQLFEPEEKDDERLKMRSSK
jgi:hypothetical protein